MENYLLKIKELEEDLKEKNHEIFLKDKEIIVLKEQMKEMELKLVQKNNELLKEIEELEDHSFNSLPECIS
tara:strand:- start:20 stop:232 length:213 start_codon:yes stop_codon:yes gene_type:complete